MLGTNYNRDIEMAKKLTFLRHYKLQVPFDNWRNMSLMEYIDFTEGRSDPSIDSNIQSYLKRTFSRDDLVNYQIIITSNRTRTAQTAESIKDYFHLDIPIVSSSLFDEIPSIILRRPTAKEWSLMVNSDKLNIDKRRVLNREEKIKRLENIDYFIQNLAFEDILVISHSYLIGQLNYFYKVINRIKENFEEEQANKYEIGGYLNGFQTHS